MKLTIKQALELTEELWTWLYENPSKEKKDWPKWKENGGPYTAVHFCFLCEFIKEIGYDPKNCVKCPLFEFFNNSRCYEPPSPVYKWYYSAVKAERSKYAKIIIDLCKKKLKILEQNEQMSCTEE